MIVVNNFQGHLVYVKREFLNLLSTLSQIYKIRFFTNVFSFSDRIYKFHFHI